MTHTDTQAASAARTERDLSRDDLLELYYFMRLTRACDNAILRLYRQGKIVGGAYTGNGNEATAVGAPMRSQRRTTSPDAPRSRRASGEGADASRTCSCSSSGRAGSLTRGRDGTGHYADPPLRIYGNVSHLAAMIPMAVGFALAATMRRGAAPWC